MKERDSVEDAIVLVRASVDHALEQYRRGSFRLPIPHEETFRSLSTSPYRMQDRLQFGDFYGLCQTFARPLAELVNGQGATVEIATSAKHQGDHTYLRSEEYGEEVLIDPTAGQFLDGMQHIFVGTREQLRRIVLEDTYILGSRESSPGRYGAVFPPAVTTRDELFLSAWGNSSVSW